MLTNGGGENKTEVTSLDKNRLVLAQKRIHRRLANDQARGGPRRWAATAGGSGGERNSSKSSESISAKDAVCQAA